MLAVLRARDLDDALRIANGTDYALTGGLYSRSPAHIERVKREFRVGNLYINRKITGALVDRQPFGGFKLSGIGTKAGGRDYLLQFLLPRTVTENTMRRGFAPEEPVTGLPDARSSEPDLAVLAVQSGVRPPHHPARRCEGRRRRGSMAVANRARIGRLQGLEVAVAHPHPFMPGVPHEDDLARLPPGWRRPRVVSP